MRLLVIIVSTMMLLFSEILIAGFDIKACEQSMLSKWDMLNCQLSFSTDEQEQKELKTKTYGIMYNISCDTHLNISKSDLIIGCLYSDKNSLAYHPISCTVKTKDESFKIGLTVKPLVQFDKGNISNIQLNIGNVTGDAIPLVKKLLVKYGNSPQLQKMAKEALKKFLHLPDCPLR
jgi:hypothetical protein